MAPNSKKRHLPIPNRPENQDRNPKPGLAARQVAATVLARVIDDGRGLDGILETRHGPSGLKNLSPADNKLVRAIATTALRNRGMIDHCLNKLMSRKPPKNARHLLHTLHVAGAQILFMDVPDSAAVDLAVTSLSGNSRSERFASLGNAVLRKLSKTKEDLLGSLSSEEQARSNMPPWMWQQTRKSFGKDRAQKIAELHMLEPVIDLTVKSDPVSWAEKLGGTVLHGNSIRVPAKGNVDTWEGFEEGEWWVQDFAAHLPAHLLGDISGKSVIDLCAAPGGKTAQLINAGATVTALEAVRSRCDRLEENLTRLKLDAKIVNTDLFDWKPDQLFDAVLLDAPCSSTGTIRRHPDVQWSKSKDQIEELATLQFNMTTHAAGFLKPGGILVFSNCSLMRSEGEDLFAKINKGGFGLESQKLTPDDMFGLEECITGQGTARTLPSHMLNITPPRDNEIAPERMGGLDGFFAARFIRTDDELG